MSITPRDKVAIGLGMGGLVSVAAAAWLLVAPTLAGPSSPGGEMVAGVSPTFQSSDSSASAVAAVDLVVDVQGAVRHPGVVLLPPGARVADALRAAGGYARDADLNAAAAALNLAAQLTDGAQVYVPVVGGPAPAGGHAGGGGGGAGLVSLNSATPEELEALPGIGPVTVQKIVAARAEQPFTTLEELVEREVMNRGQLEDIRDLVTL